MSKTERFEIRLDPEFANAIDSWRDVNMVGASRAHAVRELIRLGLNSATNASPLRFSDGEKTLIKLVGDLSRYVGAPTDKIDVLLEGFSSGNHWAVDLEMCHLYNSASTSSEYVPFVLSVLEMWDIFERAFESFSKEDQALVLADRPSEQELRKKGKQPESREIKFHGFSATDESDLLQIATFLVEKMHRFPRFKGRNLAFNKKTYQRHKMKLDYFEQLKPNLIGRLPSSQEVRDFSLKFPISIEEALIFQN